MLEVRDLRKEYKDIVAVDGISFNVREGEIFGLLGPNGAGKTTTIRTILNIIKPSSGSILFNGMPINKDFYNHIGYLPEERGLYRKSKVIDILLYFAGLKNMKRASAINEAEILLRKLNIPQYKDKKLEELSKGNQQKIQFISAIIHNPRLLILDEPFSGFDPVNQQLIKEMILGFADSGKLIILSTHQMETAEKLCSEIFLINKGKEVLSGTVPQVKKKFGGNNLRINYQGDISFVKVLPSVLHIDDYKNYAEIQLNDDVQPNEFLKQIIDHINISGFSIIEPTLHKIFIDVVKGE
jgi:ABC-2 type transport system ATP-binding protein